MLGDERVIEELKHVSGDESAVFNVVHLGVRASVRDGFLHKLHPDHPLRLIRDENRNRAGAAVKIVNEIISTDCREFLCNRVEPFGLRRVGLKESVRCNLEFVRPDHIVDDSRAEDRVDGFTVGGLRNAGVHRVHEGHDLRITIFQEHRHFSHFLFVIAVRDEIDHPLTRPFTRSNDEMAQESRMVADVPWLPSTILYKSAEIVDEFGAARRLQMAFVEVEHLVEIARHMKAERKIGIEIGSRSDFIRRQPAIR